MFLVSGPELVIAAVRAGIAGAFPAPNARTIDDLDRWCGQIVEELGEGAPWAANVLTHRSYDRLDAEIAVLARYRPPLVITALGSPRRVLDEVHAWGGQVYADCASPEHAEKAIAAGADGIVLVCAGAGGHTGTFSPFALTADVRSFWNGPLVLAGGIAEGRAVRAAEVLGADMVYIGTRFIATHESLVDEEQRQMVVDTPMRDIVLSSSVTGVPANWMKASLERSGHLASDGAGADFSGDIAGNTAWKHIWSAGHSVGQVRRIASVAEVVDELVEGYVAAGGVINESAGAGRGVAQEPARRARIASVAGPTRRAVIVGGGPAGLMSARLLAQASPPWDVTVHERLPSSQTFGFGIGLSGGTLSTLEAADPEVHAGILAVSYAYSDAEFRIPTGSAAVPGFYGGSALSRTALLEVLSQLAIGAGVDLQVGKAVDIDDVAQDADLVIAADGVSSGVRSRYAAAFNPLIVESRARSIWCGCRTKLKGNVFMAVPTAAGVFVAHAYPHAENFATVVIESDPLGPAGTSLSESIWTDDNASDDAVLTALSTIFADLLNGQPLIGNGSGWRPFSTVHCSRWWHGRTVLLGDAAATAHPSLGSGTKLALEDAIVLAQTLSQAKREDTMESTLARYEQVRRPSVDRLQERARRSRLWWESFAARISIGPARAAFSYLTRAGALSLEQVQAFAPSLTAQALADFASVAPDDVPRDSLADWVLGQALSGDGGRTARVLEGSREDSGVASLRVTCTDAWGPDGTQVLAQAAQCVRTGARVLRLVGPPSSADVLDRLAIAERIRTELDVLVAVEVDREHTGLVVDGIVAGRVDLLAVTGSLHRAVEEILIVQ
jgi:anthraniloyl-CoA monooxygenase